MAAISIRQLRKSYGKTEVIHGIDVDIDAGEFIVIVGPSGCGKSTFLRMVAGLEAVSAGTISIDGHPVNDVEPKDRDIAMVFQTYALYPHMTVHNNMAYGLKIAGLPAAEIDERVQRAAKMLELSEFLPRKPRQLSGGQRQRVAMGRAIVRNPRVFLFDEPLSNLDAKLRMQMRLEIKQLQRSLGTTSLYVTHDQVEAMTLADRLIVMNEGIAEQINTPMRVYEHPASIFVADFIGSPAMNFLAGRVTANGAAVELDAGSVLRADGWSLGADAGRAVTIGIRPENLQQVIADNADLTLQVVAIETLGADTLAHGFAVGNGHTKQTPDKMKHNLAVRLPGNSQIAEGEKLSLRIADGMLHLFDAATGKRMADG